MLTVCMYVSTCVWFVSLCILKHWLCVSVCRQPILSYFSLNKGGISKERGRKKWKEQESNGHVWEEKGKSHQGRTKRNKIIWVQWIPILAEAEIQGQMESLNHISQNHPFKIPWSCASHTTRREAPVWSDLCAPPGISISRDSSELAFLKSSAILPPALEERCASSVG